MRLNLVRLVIVVWLVLALATAFTRWTDHEVPVVVRTGVTATDLSGLTTVAADYRCAPTLGQRRAPRLVQALTDVVGPARVPCEPYETERKALVVIDIIFGFGALAATSVRGLRRPRTAPI